MPGRTVLVGAGKAAAAMARAFEALWPGQLEGLVVTRYGHAVPCERIEILEAGHPVPDEAGNRAARRILDHGGGLGPGRSAGLSHLRRRLGAADAAGAGADARPTSRR